MSKHHQVVTHYMTHHGYIPLWVLVNVLTFGKITNFYFNMKINDKKNVAKFFSVDVKELHKYMTMLGLAIASMFITKYKGKRIQCHFPMNMLIKNPELLNERECQYAMHPATPVSVHPTHPAHFLLHILMHSDFSELECQNRMR